MEGKLLRGGAEKQYREIITYACESLYGVTERLGLIWRPDWLTWIDSVLQLPVLHHWDAID